MKERDIALERGLPSSPDCEKLVLGAILTGEDYQLVAGFLSDTDFTIEKHRLIFRAAGEVYSAGQTISYVTIGELLRCRGQLDAIDGLAYLTELSDLPELVSLEHVCQVVKDKSTSRRIIFGMGKMIERCLSGEVPAEVLDRAGKMVSDLEGETSCRTTLRSFQEIIDENGGLNTYCQCEQLGIDTPWPSLNRITGGLRPGQMITIAGLTGSGKTAAALQIAQHAAEKGVGVAVFTLEMSALEIFERAVCNRAGIDSNKLERHLLSETERLELSRVAAELSSLPLWIDDTTGRTLSAMHAALRRHIQRHPVGLLVIDYLQLMKTVGKKDNRVQEVTELSRGMKLAAREFKIPVIVLSQLNRASATEKREPELHDLRESGSIEHDSDKIIFIHANPKSSNTTLVPSAEAKVDVHLIVAKQRNGKSRRYVNLVFVEKYARFEEKDGHK